MSDNHACVQAGSGGKRRQPPEPPGRELPTEDRMLALLRAAVFVGAAAWTGLAPISPTIRRHCALLLGVFLAYSVLISWSVWRWRRRARAIYIGAVAVDIAFLYFVFAETGGITSPFLPAAFLLLAVTAFRYGTILGVAAAWTAMAMAVVSDPSALATRHWSALPLLFIFVTLTAGYIGWFGRRAAEERRDVERLHAEATERARELEASYRRCRESQDQLLHAERLATIGRMSAEMAHQVRNPLSAIGLNLELIEDEISRLPELSRQKAAALLAAIQREVDNLADVTESYLRFAKLPPFCWEMADLNEIVRETLVFANPQIEQRGAKVTQRLDARLPPVQIDRRQFKFALMSVLTNAIEAISPGGRVRLKTAAIDGRVELAVSDTGPGVAPENMARLFDPFFTTKQGGTGLGLSLARRIIESHGGAISCESIPRVGATFTLAIPIDGHVAPEAADAGE